MKFKQEKSQKMRQHLLTESVKLPVEHYKPTKTQNYE